MPLTLTTPLSVGDLDARVTEYNTVKITAVHIDTKAKFVRFRYDFGYLDGDEFVTGYKPSVTKEIMDVGEETAFTDLQDTATVVGTWWGENARILYQWLIDNEGLVGIIT